MQKIKLAVTGLFVVLFLMFIGTRFFMPAVQGKGGLSAPTGLMASDASYPDKVGLNWNAVRGATTYRIFRSTVNDPLTAVNVATSASVVDFDFSPASNVTYFYWVRAENGSIVSQFSQPDQGSSFSGVDTGICCPLGQPQIPVQNTVTAAKVFLGKALFWDEQLSSTRTVSCGTCHQPAKGGSDGRSVVGNVNSTHPGPDNVLGTGDDKTGSPGVALITAAGFYERSDIFGFRAQVTRRKSPSAINAAFVSDFLFWDGRAREVFRDPVTNAVLINFFGALESQAVGPPVSSAEMAHQGRDWNQITTQLAESKPLALSPSMPAGLNDWIAGSTYPELFQEAFGTPDITPSRIAFAIASYERVLISDRAPWDKFTQTTAPVLTDAELRGRTVFNNSQCSSTCHLGSAFTGNVFFNLGVRPGSEDGGQAEITGNQNQLANFRTPSLRNVELRGPYMHNGRFATLEAVIEFYNRGGDFPNNNTIRPLNLTTQQKADLLAFIKRPLTDPRVAAETPPFDRPTLYTESNRVPVIEGTGVTGSGGVPQAIAVEPPLVGNPSFTVAVSGALGGAQATLVIHSSDPGTSGIPASGSFHRSVVNLGGSGSGNGYGSVSIAIPDNAALVNQTFFGRWYVNDASAAGGVAISQVFRFTVFGEATFAARARHADFDGDGKTDVSVFRPSDGNWYLLNSSTGTFNVVNLGIGTDILVPEDYDGDGKTDVAIYRDGGWYLQRSRDGFGGLSFGLTGDKPQPGDYDGDGIADVAVFRPSNATWYINASRDGFSVVQFGLATDRPVAGDYDGDGKTDIAIYRDGIWFIQRSRDGLFAGQFGVAEDKPVVGDYDGDSKTDLAVYRPSTGVWYFLKSGDGQLGGNQFGLSTDLPSPGDYDGDGRNDLTVYRQADGNWYILPTTSGIFQVRHWGLSEDRSVPGAFVP
jgi:cytochrome c peroxidase